jgi:hypothetical protein
MSDHAFTPEEAAIVAASQATEATAELLRYAREGAATNRAAFTEEVVGKLAEALKLAIEIDADAVLPGPNSTLDPDEQALFVNLRGAAEAFIDGWVA